MSQLKGHVVTDDRKRIGVVSDVSSEELAQPPREKRRYNEVTGKVTRFVYDDGTPVTEPVPPVQAETVTVKWEDGSTSKLTETVDQWEVLGSVRWIHASENDSEVIAAHDRAVDSALSDVKAYAASVRSAPAYPEVPDASGEDVVVVVRDGIEGTDPTSGA